MNAYRLAVDEAHRLGIHVGIYDEYNWQSGMAGGRTVQDHDHLREQHLFWSTASAHASLSLTVSGIQTSVQSLGEDALQWQYENGSAEWADWTLVAALLYPTTGASSQMVRDVTTHSRIESSSSTHCQIRVSLPSMTATSDCRVTVFISARCATSRIPNYLLTETAPRFIEVGYEPFWEALAPYFGNTIRYFFFDQPHSAFYRWDQCHGNLRSSLPYAPQLATDPKVTIPGCRFAVALLALVEDLGPDTAAMRATFYDAYSQLVMQQFLGPLHSWTAQHGIGLSGHEVLGHVGGWDLHTAFTEWDLRVNFGLDYFGVDTYRTLTGVDAEGLHPQLSAKLGDSVSRSHGRSGCIVEQYFMNNREAGARQLMGRWDLTLEEIRAQAFRLHLAGATQILTHAYYQTDGNINDCTPLKNPRFDFAPGINFEPWWPLHRDFAEESARLSIFLQGASPATEVALLYPLRTAWVEGFSHSYGRHLGFWARFLAEQGYGYHVIDERDLSSARIDNGRLSIDNRTFPAVILPSVTTLANLHSLNQIGRLLDQGGLVLSSGDHPIWYQYPAQASAASDWDLLVSRHERLWCFSGTPPAADLHPLLRPLIQKRPHAVTTDPSPLWQWAGQTGQSWRLVLFNDQPYSVHATLSIPFGYGQIQVWDVANGEITLLRHDRTPSIPLSLNPMQLLCLQINPAPVVTLSSYSSLSSSTAPSLKTLLDTSQQIPLSSNWTLRAGDAMIEISPVNVTQSWEEQGLARFSGTGTYTRSFKVLRTDGQWWLYLPRVGTAVTAELNGVRLGQRAWSPYLFSVPATILTRAQNTILLDVSNTAANGYLLHQQDDRLTRTRSGLLSVPVLLWQPPPPTFRSTRDGQEEDEPLLSPASNLTDNKS